MYLVNTARLCLTDDGKLPLLVSAPSEEDVAAHAAAATPCAAHLGNAELGGGSAVRMRTVQGWPLSVSFETHRWWDVVNQPSSGAAIGMTPVPGEPGVMEVTEYLTVDGHSVDKSKWVTIHADPATETVTVVDSSGGFTVGDRLAVLRGDSVMQDARVDAVGPHSVPATLTLPEGWSLSAGSEDQLIALMSDPDHRTVQFDALHADWRTSADALNFDANTRIGVTFDPDTYSIAIQKLRGDWTSGMEFGYYFQVGMRPVHHLPTEVVLKYAPPPEPFEQGPFVHDNDYWGDEGDGAALAAFLKAATAPVELVQLGQSTGITVQWNPTAGEIEVVSGTPTDGESYGIDIGGGTFVGVTYVEKPWQQGVIVKNVQQFPVAIAPVGANGVPVKTPRDALLARTYELFKDGAIEKYGFKQVNWPFLTDQSYKRYYGVLYAADAYNGATLDKTKWVYMEVWLPPDGSQDTSHISPHVLASSAGFPADVNTHPVFLGVEVAGSGIQTPLAVVQTRVSTTQTAGALRIPKEPSVA